MSLDFDKVVLSPLMDAFSIPITIRPLKSQPGADPYPARGIWEAQPYTMMQEGQAPLSTTIYRIGLRISEFAVPPAKGDHVLIANKSNPNITDEFALDASELDGQGGIKWILKAMAPVGGATP